MSCSASAKTGPTQQHGLLHRMRELLCSESAWRIVNLALHPAVGSSDAWHTGGKFLEDCSIAKPFDPETTPSVQGYLPYAYDTDSARQLWDLSNKLVGTSD